MKFIKKGITMTEENTNNAVVTHSNPGYPFIAGQGFHTHPERIHRAGRAKGSKNRATVLNELMSLVIEGKGLTGVNEKMSVEKAVMQSLVRKALEGDVPAIKEAQDTMYGKIEAVVDVKSSDGTMSPNQSRLDEYLALPAQVKVLVDGGKDD